MPRSELTTIDETAPVVARHEIMVDAAVPVVWALHVDVERWPSSSSEIADVSIDGRFVPGATFRWHTGGLTIDSTLHAVEPETRTLWGGETAGITGIHLWTFTPHGHRTRVRTEESWTGAPVDADPDGLQAQLDASSVRRLDDLERAADRP
jgi:hypothetical protein